MTPLQIVLLCIGIVLCLFLLHIMLSLFIAHQIYTKTLRRQSKDHWGRFPSDNSPLHLQMDGSGMDWHYANLDKKTDVHITRDGLNLYGEFYDFGSDKCAMILSGRTESLRYGYYFAQPYAKAGLSILVVDPRAHGLSDGQDNTLGFEESKDDLVSTKTTESITLFSTGSVSAPPEECLPAPARNVPITLTVWSPRECSQDSRNLCAIICASAKS